MTIYNFHNTIEFLRFYLQNQPKKGRGRSVPLKELGPHPDTKAVVQVLNGKYGPYIKSGETNVSLPEGLKPEDVTLQKALELLAQKAPKAAKPKQKRA